MKNRQRNSMVINRRLCQNGFTLLEVLLAVMILGISVTAILYQFSVALRAGSTSQDVTTAVLHAKEKLEEIKIKKNLGESLESGSFEDGYLWETHSTVYPLSEKEGESPDETVKHEIFQLKAIVKWQFGEREKQVELTTLKTVKKKEWDQSG